MPRNIVHGEDYLYDRAAILDYYCDGSDNTDDRIKMRRILAKALNNELTSRQRICITGYYLDGKKMKDIAVSLGVHPSTVTRHIKSAEDKLRHIASYY